MIDGPADNPILVVSAAAQHVGTSLEFLPRLGCNIWTLARIAGHSSIAISARYVHQSEDAVLTAISRLPGHDSGHSEEIQQKTPSSEALLNESESRSERPERFELPTFWFVEVLSRKVNELHGMAWNGLLRPKSPHAKMFRLSIAGWGLWVPSAAKQDFGHKKSGVKGND